MAELISPIQTIPVQEVIADLDDLNLRRKDHKIQQLSQALQVFLTAENQSYISAARGKLEVAIMRILNYGARDASVYAGQLIHAARNTRKK